MTSLQSSPSVSDSVRPSEYLKEPTPSIPALWRDPSVKALSASSTAPSQQNAGMRGWYLEVAVRGQANLMYAQQKFTTTMDSDDEGTTDQERPLHSDMELDGKSQHKKKRQRSTNPFDSDYDSASPSPPTTPSSSASSSSSLSSSRASHVVYCRGSYGQDAYFVSGDGGFQCLGVADGVGGWRANGVDSGEMSRAMMQACQRIVKEQAANDRQQATDLKELRSITPGEIMIEAYRRVHAEGRVEAGSTTACLVALTPSAPVLTPHNDELDHWASGSSDDDHDMHIEPKDGSAMLHKGGEKSKESNFDMHTETDKEKEERPHGLEKSSNGPQPINGPASGLKIVLDDKAVTGSSSSTPSSPKQLSLNSPSNALGNLGLHSAPSTPSNAALHAPTTLPNSSSLPSQSSTVYLTSANLGDSGYVVLRNGKVCAMSEFQREGRIVKQLAVIPPRFQGPEHHYCDDKPEEAILETHEIQEDDMIVLASDGLWDNLIPPNHANSIPYMLAGIFRLPPDPDPDQRLQSMRERIEAIVKRAVDAQKKKPAAAQKAQTDNAAAVSTNSDKSNNGHSHSLNVRSSNVDSAECQLIAEALKAEAMQYMNTLDGKPDDLTIVVAKVKKDKTMA